MLANVNGFLLDYLGLALLRAVRSEARVLTLTLSVAVTCISTLLIKWLLSTRGTVLLYDEVRRSIDIGISGLHDLLVLRADLVWELADVVEQLAALLVLHGPFGHIIVGLLLLKPLQNDLILSRDFHQLALAGLAVQAFLVARIHHVGALHALRRLSCRDSTDRADMRVSIGDALWILQNVGHFLEKDAIFSLNLSVPLCKRKKG